MEPIVLSSNIIIGALLILVPTLLIIFTYKSSFKVNDWRFGMHEILFVIYCIVMFDGIEYVLFGFGENSIKQFFTTLAVFVVWLMAVLRIRKYWQEKSEISSSKP